MIPRQKEVILAIGPHRHLSRPEIVQAICLEKRYGRFYQRFFCNTYSMALAIGWLKVSGKIENYRHPEHPKEKFDRPHYRLTPQGQIKYFKLFVPGKLKSPHWSIGF